MTAYEFAFHVLTLAVEFRFSVTSWGRTRERNARAKGLKNSYHLAFCAVDVVLDDHEAIGTFSKRAKQLGVEVIAEGDHLHVEPAT